jgi:hypothetical protein
MPPESSSSLLQSHLMMASSCLVSRAPVPIPGSQSHFLQEPCLDPNPKPFWVLIPQSHLVAFLVDRQTSLSMQGDNTWSLLQGLPLQVCGTSCDTEYLCARHCAKAEATTEHTKVHMPAIIVTNDTRGQLD